jgi:hypothetical protein
MDEQRALLLDLAARASARAQESQAKGDRTGYLIAAGQREALLDRAAVLTAAALPDLDSRIATLTPRRSWWRRRGGRND